MPEDTSLSVGRREFLATAVGLGSIGTAGCTGIFSSSSDEVDTSDPASLSQSWIRLYELRTNDPDKWLDTIESDVHERSKYLDGIDDALDFYRTSVDEGNVSNVSAELVARDLSEVEINSLRMPQGVETGGARALSNLSTALVDGTYDPFSSDRFSNDSSPFSESVRHFLAVEDEEWQFVDIVRTE